jgi:hypothetical protein
MEMAFHYFIARSYMYNKYIAYVSSYGKIRGFIKLGNQKSYIINFIAIH